MNLEKTSSFAKLLPEKRIDAPTIKSPKLTPLLNFGFDNQLNISCVK